MLSPISQALVAAMQTEPNRPYWTATALSAVLDCTPDVARGRLRTVVKAGVVERIGEGAYRLVRKQPKPATPAPEAPAIQVTELMCEQVVAALRSYGSPLHASTLAGRLRRSGFDLKTVEAVAARLCKQGELRRSQKGKLMLPHWRES